MSSPELGQYHIGEATSWSGGLKHLMLGLVFAKHTNLGLLKRLAGAIAN